MRSDAGPLVSREFLSAYISGYPDGEGCFTVFISPRATLAVGWEVRPSFSVGQNGDRAEVLHALQAHFGCGSIRPDRSDKTLKWETRRLDELVGRVIPHFIRYPLLSAKRLDGPQRDRYDADELLARLFKGEGIVCASGNGG